MSTKKYIPALKAGADFEVTGPGLSEQERMKIAKVKTFAYQNYQGKGGGKVHSFKTLAQAKSEFKKLATVSVSNLTQGHTQTFSRDLETGEETSTKKLLKGEPERIARARQATKKIVSKTKEIAGDLLVKGAKIAPFAGASVAFYSAQKIGGRAIISPPAWTW